MVCLCVCVGGGEVDGWILANADIAKTRLPANKNKKQRFQWRTYFFSMESAKQFLIIWS